MKKPLISRGDFLADASLLIARKNNIVAMTKYNDFLSIANSPFVG
jgi:hypothetical protein